MFQDDIEQLVAMTFQEAELYSKSKEIFGFEGYDTESDDSNLKKPDEGPGVLYYLQKNVSTFVVRILVCENLKTSFKEVLENPEEYPSLRLLNSEDERELIDKLDFFECDNLQVARTIKDQLANKRFPLYEERVLNVSDPGDNWWIKRDGSDLSVFFKLCRTESMDSLVKAGPLGDCEGALKFFNQLFGYFSLLFPVKDYSSAHGQLHITCEEQNNPIFEEVVSIFTEGEMGNRLWEKLREIESHINDERILSNLRRANYFLMEVASLRNFWIEIQQKLS